MDFFKKHKMLTLLLMLVSLILAPAFLYNGVLEAISVTPGAPDEGAHPGSDLIASGPLVMPGAPEVMVSPATLNSLLNGWTFDSVKRAYTFDAPDAFGYTRAVIINSSNLTNHTSAPGHVKGAWVWTYGEQRATRTDGVIAQPTNWNISTQAKANVIINRAGIDANTVVIFTGANLANMGRAYFNFRYWGFPRERLRVLNGTNLWFNSLYPGQMETGADPADAGSAYNVCDLSQATTVDEVRVSLAEMISVAADSDPHTIPWDVRSQAEWDGTNTNSTYAFTGRMKTAVFWEHTNLYITDGPSGGRYFKPKETIIADMNAAGMTHLDTLYTY